MRTLDIKQEIWPLAEKFTISRISLVQSYVLVVEIGEGDFLGRGECEPHESDPQQMIEVESIIEGLRSVIEEGLTREALQTLLPAGPARNAIDCALWDLEAKIEGRRVWEMAEVKSSNTLVTAYTISIDSPQEMAAKAGRNKDRSLLKIKLSGEGNMERITAVRAAAPDVRLIVDANEAWTYAQLLEFSEPMAKLGVELIEQPLPAGADQELEDYFGPVPLCADESCLDRNSLVQVEKRYSFINIKLDKTGGLTEALKLAKEANSQGLKLMVGCMTGTSLAMAPAMIIGAMAEFCDLDGPLLLAKDRQPGLAFNQSMVSFPEKNLWG